VSTDVDLFGGAVAPRRLVRHGEQQHRGQDEWLTPPALLQALGPFDLDPCAPINRPWPTAAHHFTVVDDGLRQPWQGFVWLNPPYSNLATWMGRLADHGDGIALLFARTETGLWQDHIWPHATELLFLRGRVRFRRSGDGREADNDSGSPSVLIGYGRSAADRLRGSGLSGHLVTPLGRVGRRPHGVEDRTGPHTHVLRHREGG